MVMVGRGRSLPAAALALVLLAGCDAAREIRARSAPPVDPFGTDALARAAADLERRLGAPVKALDVEASEHRIVFQVQDPARPQNVDAYELRNGELLGPQPVQLMGETDLEASLFPLAEVPLGRVPELTKAALAAIELEDGKVTSLHIRREFSLIPADIQARIDESRRQAGLTVEEPEMPDGAVRVEMYVDSPRRKGYVLANDTFEVVRTSVL